MGCWDGCDGGEGKEPKAVGSQDVPQLPAGQQQKAGAALGFGQEAAPPGKGWVCPGAAPALTSVLTTLTTSTATYG